MPQAAPKHRALSFGPDGWIESGAISRTTVNPSRPTEDVGVVEDLDPSQVERVIDRTVAAAAAWRGSALADRSAVLRRVASRLRDQESGIGTLIAREMGKPVSEARGEVMRAAAIFDYYAAEASRPVASSFAGAEAHQEITVVRAPVGTVAVITPWNFPIAIPAWKIAPALIYGDAVVWKPSPLAPLVATRLMEVIVDAGLPNGVLTLLQGDGAVGSHAIRHRLIDAVSFTGSTVIGRSIVAQCAERGVAVQAELGGKNSVVVWSDADLEAAARGVVTGAFSSAGQKCTATSRVIVARSVVEEFCAALRRVLSEQRLGDAEDPQTTVGPVISREAQRRLGDAIDSLPAGSRIIATIEPGSASGWFAAPTIALLDSPAGEAWTTELFGPLVVMVVVETIDEAIGLVNDTPFGLAAAIYTKDRDRMRAAVQGMDVGMLAINEPTTGGYPFVPFGGWKASGYGPREQGEDARLFYTRTKTVHSGR